MKSPRGELRWERVVLSAIRLADTQTFGKQDPYVVLKCGEHAQFRTKVCRDGGTAPTWNERFTFPIQRGERELHVRIWNSNTLTSDKCIGSCVVELDKVFKDEYDDVEVMVVDVKGRQAGLLNVILTFTPSQTSRTAGAPAAQTAPAAPAVTNGGRFLGVNPKTQRRREEMQQQMLQQMQQQHVQPQPYPQASAPVTYLHVPPHQLPHHPPPHGHHPPPHGHHPPPHGHHPPPHHHPHGAYVPRPIAGYHEGYTGGPGGVVPPPPGWHQAPPPSGNAYPEDDVWG
jgi:hypothetical protein